MRDDKDTNLKTFNTAKVFAENILFPLMSDYKKFQRQSNFGSFNLEDSTFLNEEIREIERYNGLKAMSDTCYDLAEAIESTVRLKGNKEEVTQLNECKLILDQVKNVCYENKDLFFVQVHKNGQLLEGINRAYFEKVKKIVQSCYVNIEILMTRNKLLFADSNDEFQTDTEIKEEILKRYTEG